MNEINLKEILLYEDDDLIALNKPSGILTIEDGYDRNKFNLRSELRKVYGLIWAVHRLDKDTSGILIFAKNKESHRQLNLSFSNRETEKNYRCIVNGFPIWDSFEVNLPLKVNGDRNHRTVFDPLNGKPAVTRIDKLMNNEQYTYMDIFPTTGLTHQIRAHLSAIGFPILGDRLYWRCCGLSKISKFQQMDLYLHALSLKFNHPSSKESILITAPLPLKFSEILANFKF
jgi:tRNA pseudouridine32 synthase/23S rRNA pseudouridine746 synthase